MSVSPSKSLPALQKPAGPWTEGEREGEGVRGKRTRPQWNPDGLRRTETSQCCGTAAVNSRRRFQEDVPNGKEESERADGAEAGNGTEAPRARFFHPAKDAGDAQAAQARHYSRRAALCAGPAVRRGPVPSPRSWEARSTREGTPPTLAQALLAAPARRRAGQAGSTECGRSGGPRQRPTRRFEGGGGGPAV